MNHNCHEKVLKKKKKKKKNVMVFLKLEEKGKTNKTKKVRENDFSFSFKEKTWPDNFLPLRVLELLRKRSPNARKWKLQWK